MPTSSETKRYPWRFSIPLFFIIVLVGFAFDTPIVELRLPAVLSIVDGELPNILHVYWALGASLVLGVEQAALT